MSLAEVEQGSIDGPAHEFELTRAQWMLRVGRKLYEDYFQYVTELTPPTAAELSNRSFDVASNLMQVGEETAYRLSKAEKWDEQNPLFAHTTEILHYTAADDLSEDGVGDTIRAHNKDSLLFAHRITLALATEIIDSTEGIIRDRSTYFRSAAAILGNPNFTDVQDTFATTALGLMGFAYVSSAPYEANFSGIKRKLDLLPHKAVIATEDEIGSVEDFAAATYAVDEKAQYKLTSALRSQNALVAMGKTAGVDSAVMRRHLYQSNFSRGCPVAHGRTFEALDKYLAKTILLTDEKLLRSEMQKKCRVEPPRRSTLAAVNS